MYACITGVAPQPADARLTRDQLTLATVIGQGKYTNQFLETIDWCMRLDYLSRPQSGFQLQKALMENLKPPSRTDSAVAKVTSVFEKLLGK